MSKLFNFHSMHRETLFFWFLLSALFLICPLAKAEDSGSLTQYEISLTPTEESLNLEKPIGIKVAITSPRLSFGSCLYVPALDPNFLNSLKIKRSRGSSIQDQALRSDPSWTWTPPPGIKELRPYLFALQNDPPSEKLVFSGEVGLIGWKDKSESARFLSQFYPKLLDHCPEAEEEPFFWPSEKAQFHVELETPSPWKVLAPGTPTQKGYSYRGGALSLVFYQTGQTLDLPLGNGTLKVLFHSESFKYLSAEAAKATAFFQQKIGDNLSPDTLMIETDDFEPLRNLGLVTLNRPQQPLLQSLQERYLRFNLWQLVMRLADQWFGQSVRAESLQFQWLTQSLADQITLMYLQSDPKRQELFVDPDGGDPYLSLNYREAQDLIAAFLRVFESRNQLPTSAQEKIEQPSGPPQFLFIRSSQAFRYVAWFLGDDSFSFWLKDLVRLSRKKTLTPDILLANLADYSTLAAKDLALYWKTSTWPDMGFVEIQEQDEHSSILKLGQNPDLPLAFDVHIEGSDGKVLKKNIGSRNALTEVSLPWPKSAVQSVLINPGREIFDSDRFNNSFNNSFATPSVSFFPGNARGLADDAYTVLWLPSMAKLPGQGLSLRLNWQAMRYLGSDLSGMLIYRTDRQNVAYHINYRQVLPDPQKSWGLNLSDGEALGVTQERKISGYFRIDNFPSRNVSSQTDILLKESPGNHSASHIAQSVQVGWEPDLDHSCNLNLNLKHEWSSWVPTKSFSYRRSMTSLETDCQKPWIQMRLRLFKGASQHRGDAPDIALFQSQNLDEMGLRLDRPSLPPAARIDGLRLDLGLPIALPISSNFFILPRRTQLRFFSDWAEMKDPQKSAQASGMGLVLPLGGDVIGRSSITLIQFSLYGVLYRRIDSFVNKEPGIIFDFTGKI